MGSTWTQQCWTIWWVSPLCGQWNGGRRWGKGHHLAKQRGLGAERWDASTSGHRGSQVSSITAGDGGLEKYVKNDDWSLTTHMQNTDVNQKHPHVNSWVHFPLDYDGSSSSSPSHRSIMFQNTVIASLIPAWSPRKQRLAWLPELFKTVEIIYIFHKTYFKLTQNKNIL